MSALVPMASLLVGAACKGTSVRDVLDGPHIGSTQGGRGGEATGSGTGGQGGVTASAGGSGASAGTGGAGGSSGMGAAGAGQGGASSSTTGPGGGGGGPCGTFTATFPLDPSPHVPECSPLIFSTNPPTSGNHYPVWAAYKTYTMVVPRGFYVHGMEHGAVTILYNCPQGCDAELAELAAFLDARPADPTCAASGVKFRVVVTPDPLIDTRFAAAAWGAYVKSSCFDLAALGTFMDTYYGHGAEDICSDGYDVSAPNAIPADCGQ